MFNLKDKTQIDRVQIIDKNSRPKISNVERAGWGIGFEESTQHQAKVESQKKPAPGNQFPVRIYNVY
jgi:hypothetical protein